MVPVVLDVVWGLIAFAAVLAVTVLTRQNQDIRPVTLAVYVAFFAAAFFRTRPQRDRVWLTPVTVAFGGIAPVITMNLLGVAFTAHTFIASFLLMSICAAVLGAGIRLLYARSEILYAAVLGGLSAAVAVAVIFVAIPRWEENAAYQEVDQAVEPFSIETLTGKHISSGDWKGHIVVLSFWATWCTPCQAELPEIGALQARYSGNRNVLIYALDSGNDGDTASKAQAFLSKRNFSVNSAIDSFTSDRHIWGLAAKSLRVTSLPALYILDRSGRLRVIHLGYDSSEHLADSLSRRIEQLL